ncbi:MAG TPA: NTP transferase domain-containing protein [Allosphingosinicella sp.]
MKCLIIAAGMGSRLRTLAPSKPLAHVNGTPLIAHVLRAAQAGGATSFVVVTGYEAAGIERALPGLARSLGVTIGTVHNAEWERPNGLSVLAAADRLDEPFVLLMSDHLFDPAILAGLIAAHRSDAALTLAVDENLTSPILDVEDATKVDVGPDGRILRIGKTILGYTAIDTGIFLATPALLGAIRDAVAAGGAGSLSEGVQRLAAEGRAYAAPIGNLWWIDVDDEAAHARAEATLPAALAAA